MVRKKNGSNKTKRRLFLLGGFSICTIIFTTVTIGKYWVDIYEKYQESKSLSVQLKNLKKKEAVLKVDANKMQDPDYIARYAREKYLYSKNGEFILRIP
ncbi:MAG: septum formation initiator family protein [Bacilli bacterium]|nr:septum formation initiator family protein [Bacilli bacterium]